MGVTQGSVLGPLLSTLYINDLPKQRHDEIQMYADDTIVYTPKQPQKACPFPKPWYNHLEFIFTLKVKGLTQLPILNISWHGLGSNFKK